MKINALREKKIMGRLEVLRRQNYERTFCA